METPVLVVGGDEDFINTVFRAKLAPHGIHIAWVWDRFSSPNYQVPKGCQGILIIKSAIGHGMADQAAAMARDAGVPWVRVEHRFSKALPLLRAIGMIEPKASGTAQSPPSREDKYTVAFDYLSQEIDKGRAPSRGEIRGVIKRAFGPHVSIPDSLVKKARNIIVAHKATPTTSDEELMIAETTEKKIQLAEWLVLLIEEKPEAGHVKWMERLRELTVGQVPEQDKLLSLVKTVHAEQKALWGQHHRKWTDEKRETIRAMRRGWLKRQLSDNLDKHGVFPSYTHIRDASIEVLVKPIHTSKIKEVKVEVEQERGMIDSASTPDESAGNGIQIGNPPQTEGPPWLVHQNSSYSEERVDKAAAFARRWKRKLSASQAHAMDDWLNRLLQHGSKATTPSKVRDRFKMFRRKPLEFAGAILLIVPKGTRIPRTLAITAYRAVMRVGMSYYNIEIMANALRLTNRLMPPVESKKQGGQKAAQTQKDNKATKAIVGSAVPAVPEGFFPSLRDAHQYFLSKAVSHVGKHSFRKLLEDGKLEGLRRGDGLYAPWMISTASIDRYISELGAQTGIDATDARVIELSSKVDFITAEARDWKSKAQEAAFQVGEWKAKAEAAGRTSWSAQTTASQTYADEWETKALTAQRLAEEWEERNKVTGLERDEACRENAQNIVLVGTAQNNAARIQSKHDQTLLKLSNALRSLDEANTSLGEAQKHIVELEASLAKTAMAPVAEPTPEPPPAPAPVSVSNDLISQVMASGYRLVIEPA